MDGGDYIVTVCSEAGSRAEAETLPQNFLATKLLKSRPKKIRAAASSAMRRRGKRGMSQAGEVAIEIPSLIIFIFILVLFKSNKASTQTLTHLTMKELAHFLQT